MPTRILLQENTPISTWWPPQVARREAWEWWSSSTSGPNSRWLEPAPSTTGSSSGFRTCLWARPRGWEAWSRFCATLPRSAWRRTRCTWDPGESTSTCRPSGLVRARESRRPYLSRSGFPTPTTASGSWRLPCSHSTCWTTYRSCTGRQWKLSDVLMFSTRATSCSVNSGEMYNKKKWIEWRRAKPDVTKLWLVSCSIYFLAIYNMLSL